MMTDYLTGKAADFLPEFPDRTVMRMQFIVLTSNAGGES